MLVQKKNVLIFPAGSEIGFEIYDSLKYSHHVNVFGASGRSDHASFLYSSERYIEDPRLFIDCPEFIDFLNECLEKLDIQFIFPTHDTISFYLAKNQARLKATVITSCVETNDIARHKSKTYELFRNESFIPKVYADPPENFDAPLFLKPDEGQGGKGAFCVETRAELEYHLQRNRSLIICEYLPGEELSVDCFTDFRGRLLFVGPRSRDRINIGISFRTTSEEPDSEILGIANTLNQKLSFDGAWFFQVKKDRDGAYKLLEIAPRQSSTMGLYRFAGVNFALLSFFNAQKIKVKIGTNPGRFQLDRCLRSRYKSDIIYNHVYIDFDETIIADNKAHPLVMAFLYQCRNKNIRITLITKHEYDLDKTLAQAQISKKIFNQIIHLKVSDRKVEHLDPEGSIFIDNHWADREVARRSLGIPVFDVDAIECLLK